jgi:hypothetical protein
VVPQEASDEFDVERVQELLDELAERLVKRGVEGTVYIVGGAALALSYYELGERRLTSDIDAVYSPRAVIDEIVTEIAQDRGISSNWLNQKASQFFPAHGLPDGQVVIEREGLTVSVGPAPLILAMKLRAARLGRDNDDIAVLLRLCDIRSVDEAIAVLDEWYDGEEPFKPMARLIVDAALGEYAVNTARPPFTLTAMPSR